MAIDGNELVKPVLANVEEKMKKAIEHLEAEFERIRAGRATTHTLDPVKVELYGSVQALKHVANISIPEPRQILISPFDKNAIKAIEKGIINADLGLNPSSDGKHVRVEIPALTEERRIELGKQLKKIAENAKVSIRAARHDGNNELDKLEKEKHLSEDRRDNEKDTIQELHDKFIKEIESLLAKKDEEIMTV